MKIRDIAKLAGVSISTVSRVINNYDNVPEETKKSIMKIVEETGYIPNSNARSLTGKRNKTIGLFIMEIHNFPLTNLILPSDWFTNIIAAIISEASKKDYNTLVTLVTSKSDLEKATEMFRSKSICGGIFVGAEKDVPELIELDRLGYKIALLEQSIDEESNRNNSIFVNTDNFNGAYEATKYLIAKGHKNIVHIMGNSKKAPTSDRLKGYKKALASEGISLNNDLIIKGDYYKELAYENVKKLVQNRIEFSAIFAASDDMALGAIEALDDLGISVPDEVSIIGYDDTVTARLKGFSSVKANTATMAKLLVDNLIALIENQNNVINRNIVESNLEIRNSIKEKKWRNYE